MSQSVMEVTRMCRTECETLVLIKISYKENEKRKLTLRSWTLTFKKIKNILPFYDCLGKKNYPTITFLGVQFSLTALFDLTFLAKITNGKYFII